MKIKQKKKYYYSWIMTLKPEFNFKNNYQKKRKIFSLEK